MGKLRRAGRRQQIFNADPGSLSVYDTSGLPAQYESPKPGAVARVETFVKLLGGQ